MGCRAMGSGSILKGVHGAIVALGVTLATITVTAFVPHTSALPTVPVPDPIVIVHTESGGVVRDTPVPIGGVPIPIDVDNGSLLGVLSPDVDVSVGLVALDELPNSPLVPNIVVTRDATAVLRHAPAPPLKLNARIGITDVANLRKLATIDYGFETPAGTRMPPSVVAKLVGPATSGFVDPLKAKLQTPGYSGPLTFNLKAQTDDFKGSFALKFDPLPEAITINEDPGQDGLQFTYDHTGTTTDVKLEATADLTAGDGTIRHIGANVERLPNHLQLTDTTTGDATAFEYQAGADLGKPDLEAAYRQTAADGTIVTDAGVRITGLPAHMRGTVDTKPGPGASTDIDGVAFDALDGGVIDAVDFRAQNFSGPGGSLPAEPDGPEQAVSVVSRTDTAGIAKYRATGRLQQVRSVAFARTGGARDALDVTSRIGNGVLPLQAVLDIDDRPTGRDGKRLRLASTVRPLPAQLHALYEPENNQHLRYEASAPADVDVDALIAEGSADGCGQDRVICADAGLDHLPSAIDVRLPSADEPDISISHNGDGRQAPDLRATVDIGPDSTATSPSARLWANARIDDIPVELRGRLDTRGGVLRDAEFHGCDFDLDHATCRDAVHAIGDVAFTVRDRPSRAGLPSRTGTAQQFVSFISRDHAPGPKRFEAAGHVSGVRALVFRKRDEDAGEGGALGAQVQVGNGGDPFDVAVDTDEDAQDADGHLIGAKTSRVGVHVVKLPANFSACVRPNADGAAAGDPGEDPLLGSCEAAHEDDVTPLSATYTATDAAGRPAPTDLQVDYRGSEPDADDRDALGNPFPAVTALKLGVSGLPAFLHTDVVPQGTGRPLRIDYTSTPPGGQPDANGPDTAIDFDVQQRRSTSVCADPRPQRKAVCLSGTLAHVPAQVGVRYDPDDATGALDFTSAVPRDAAHKLSIDPLHVSKVDPDPDATPLRLDGAIDGITPHLVARIQSLPLDGEAAASPARLRFDACPEGGTCAGIDRIAFTATNAPIGDPLPAVPDPVPAIPGFIGQQLTFVQANDLFRAQGEVRNLKQIGYERLGADDRPSPATRLTAAFGDGSPLRAYIDRDTGEEQERADIVLRDAPQQTSICFRGPATAGALPEQGSFCEKRDADGNGTDDTAGAAVQAGVDAGNDAHTDIDVRSFTVGKDSGTDVLAGSLSIDDLAQRVDALVNGDNGEVLVEGHDRGDQPGAPAKDVSGRVTFDLRTFADANGLVGFPWQSLDGVPDPKDDAANDDAGARNYVQLAQDHDGDRLRAQGSIPAIRRLAISKQACPDDPTLFPVGGFPAGQAPQYTCARVAAAAGRPLGLSVRTLDDGQQMLAIDGAHLTALPDELAATIATSPDGADALPTCSAARAVPCRPPLLSLEAPRSGGEAPRLDARLSTGSVGDVRELRAATPDDAVSRRLDYEAAPGAMPLGARIKVGSGAHGSALRVAAHLEVPRFLDIDPPTSFDCTHENVGSGAGCNAHGVGSSTNHGFASRDIGLALVAADDHHFGNPAADHPRLGRVAVMVTPLAGKPTDQQFVITGARAPDGVDPLVHRATPGADSHYAESPGPRSEADDGFDAPAHLDARIFLRSDYNTAKLGGGSRNQVDFTQVDGRVNVPLSLTLRLNARAPEGEDAEDFVPSTNRAQQLVPRVQLTIRNAASSNNRDEYDKPTFRIRSELRGSPASTGGGGGIGDALKGFFLCDADGQLLPGNIGLRACVVVPQQASPRYVDVQLNADPFSDGSSSTDPQPGRTGAARTIDVVGGPFGSTNHVELRGWRDVDGSGGPQGKGAPADITPVATVDLRDFNFGFRVGGGIGLLGVEGSWELLGDLALGVAGHAVEQTRIDSTYGTLRLESSGGADPNDFSRVITDLREQERLKVTASVFFGLGRVDLVDARTPPFHLPVQFNGCGPQIFPSFDEFWTGDSSVFLNAGPGDRKAGIGLGTPAALTSGVTNVLSRITDLASVVECRFDPGTPGLVTTQHPAPGYELAGHAVPGATGVEPTPTDPPDDLPDDLPEDDLDSVTVGADATEANPHLLCGSYELDTLQVDGFAAVGAPGQTDPAGHQCDGHLTVAATTINVSHDGVVSAAGALPAAAGDPQQGSAGGTVSLVAKDAMRVDGLVTADGAIGETKPEDTGGACLTGGRGGDAGTVEIAANQIASDGGTLSVHGGNAGPGGIGGTAGKGGILRINAIVDATDHVLLGGRGYHPQRDFCDGPADDHPTKSSADGAPGTVEGEHPELISTVDLNSATPGPFTNGNPKVSMRAVSHRGGPLRLSLCRRLTAFGSDAFTTPALDPSGSTAAEIEQNATCSHHFFAGPNHDDNLYSVTIQPELTSGVYGFFTIAYEVSCPPGSTLSGELCFSGASGVPPSQPILTPQDVMPTIATAKIGVDKDQPTVNAAQVEDGGTKVCDSPAGPVATCVIGSEATIDIDARDEEGSGIGSLSCHVVNAAAPDGQDVDCNARPMKLPLAEGSNTIDVTATDLAGNAHTEEAVLRVFADVQTPGQPRIDVVEHDAAVNGWHRIKPDVRVSAVDPAPGSGFAAHDLHLRVDGNDTPCGAGAPSASAGLIEARCEPGELAAHLPAEGRHVLTATATDRVGREATPAPEAVIKVDSRAPSSQLALSPAQPDGGHGFYLTQPFFALSAQDRPGGSGVNPADDADGVHAGIRVSVDGGTFAQFDPEAPNLLGDGEHTICWFAIDVAGNREDADPAVAGDQDHCVEHIKVDATAPTASDTIAPAQPDGANGFYVHRPTVSAVGADAGADAGSGVDTVQVQLDEGAWTSAASVLVPEGVHTVRTRAIDQAGNVSAITERDVAVDLTKPVAVQVPYPAGPNTRGWLRQTRAVAVAVSDARGSSGADGGTSQLDSLAEQPLGPPELIGAGTHTLKVKPRDRAGLVGSTVSQTAKVDLTVPQAQPSSSTPSPILISLLGIFGTTDLKFTLADDLTPKVRATVVIYGLLGNVVRHMPFTTGADATGFVPAAGAKQVTWNGKDDTNHGVLPGTYSFRVQITDEAGHTNESTESPSFLVIQGLL